MSKFKYMVFNNDYEKSFQIKEELILLLNQEKFEEDVINPDFVFIIGGDGTMLKAVNELQDIIDQVIFIPIKSGSLGFYSTFEYDNFDIAIDMILSNHTATQEFCLLEVNYNNESHYALNEIRIVDHFRTLQTDIWINDEILENYRGSGLVFCTNTGSTGYMKAVGGAIILSKHSLWEMKEIAPISNYKFNTINAPILLDQRQSIKLNGDLINKNIIIDTFQHTIKDENITINLSSKMLKIMYDPDRYQSLVLRLKNLFSFNFED